MNSISVPSTVTAFSGQSISWAGLCPWSVTPCFGTDSGDVVFQTTDRRHDRQFTTLKGLVSEPVNGVAFHGRYMAVTSRQEITVVKQVGRDHDGWSVQKTTFDFGCHSVTSSRPAGGFIAPNGSSGYTLVFPTDRDVETLTRECSTQDDDRSLNFYQLTRVGATADDGRDIIAHAVRDGGIVVMTDKQGTGEDMLRQFGSGPLEKMDFIDVVPFRDRRYPRAVLGLGIHGNILFIPDAWESVTPISFSPPPRRSIQAYRLLLVGGHGFILTSDTLEVLPELSDRLVASLKSNPEIRSHSLATDTFEMFPCGDGDFFLVDADGVAARFKASEFVASIADGRTRGARSVRTVSNKFDRRELRTMEKVTIEYSLGKESGRASKVRGTSVGKSRRQDGVLLAR